MGESQGDSSTILSGIMQYPSKLWIVQVLMWTRTKSITEELTLAPTPLHQRLKTIFKGLGALPIEDVAVIHLEEKATDSTQHTPHRLPTYASRNAHQRLSVFRLTSM